MNTDTVLGLFNQACRKSFFSFNRLATQVDFAQLMRDQGAIWLGQGMYSSVWDCGGDVIKINSCRQGPFDGFPVWLDHCDPSNPHMPRFSDMVTDGDRYAVKLERLTPVDTINYSELVDMMQTNQAFADAIDMALRAFTYSSGAVKVDLFDLDIHEGNLMLRGDTLVINDPVPFIQNKKVAA